MRSTRDMGGGVAACDDCYSSTLGQYSAMEELESKLGGRAPCLRSGALDAVGAGVVWSRCRLARSGLDRGVPGRRRGPELGTRESGTDRFGALGGAGEIVGVASGEVLLQH